MTSGRPAISFSAAPGGQVYGQGTALTISLFIGLVVAKFAMGTAAYFLHISDDGGSWVGAVNLKDPADVVRIGFTYHLMTATGSMKYDTLLHPPAPPAAAPHGHDHGHDGTHT